MRTQFHATDHSLARETSGSTHCRRGVAESEHRHPIFSAILPAGKHQSTLQDRIMSLSLVAFELLFNKHHCRVERIGVFVSGVALLEISQWQAPGGEDPLAVRAWP